MTEDAMTRASAAVAAYAEAQLDGPYIYGATAQVCTIGYRLSRADQYPEYADKIQGYCPALSGDGVGCAGCPWEGRKAHDCATLTRFAAEAAGLSLPSGATSQWQDGDWAASGLIADLPQVGYICMVYRRSSGRMVHTGVYMGDGTVIEARGHKDGVIRSELGDYPWTHWAILRGMCCPPGATLLQALPVLRKGARGEDVIRLQEALISAGYSVGDKGADGIFGASTRMAVMELQRDARIGVDGVAGELTWAALRALDGEQDELPEDDEPEEIPTETWERMTSSQREDWLLEAVRSLVDYIIELGHERVLQDGQLADRLIALTEGGETDGESP